MNKFSVHDIVTVLFSILAVGLMVGYSYTDSLEFVVSSFTAIILAVNYMVLGRLSRIERRLYGK